MAGRTPFPAYPNGWFGVADSDSLAVGTLMRLRYFGRELLLFRARGGAARLFDAHGPPQARLRSWRLEEKNGVILAWHHARAAEPDWHVPVIPEWQAPGWSEPVRRSFRVRAHCQEMAENVVDDAHFKYVHGTHTKPVSSAEIDGPVFRAVQRTRVGTPRGDVDGRIEIASFGLGFGCTRFTGVVETLVVISGAPIDEEWSETTLRFQVKRLGSEDATRGVGRAFVAEIDRQFAQDIPIWENKAHWTRPVLCDGDGPIALLRRWAQQFYCEPTLAAGGA